MLRLEVKDKYFTVPKAIRELEKIEMVCRNNGHYRLDHAVTKKRKTILSCFGMDDGDIRKTAAWISDLLKKNQSLLSETEEDEGEGVDFDGEIEIDYLD